MNAKTKSFSIRYKIIQHTTNQLRVLRDRFFQRRFRGLEDFKRAKLPIFQADAAVGRVRIGARGGSAGDEPVWNEIAATNAKP